MSAQGLQASAQGNHLPTRAKEHMLHIAAWDGWYIIALYPPWLALLAHQRLVPISLKQYKQGYPTAYHAGGTKKL